MTKKHFIALADTLHNLLYEEQECVSFSQHQRDMIAKKLADFCQAQNSQFDRAKWLGYIVGKNGPNGGKVVKDISPVMRSGKPNILTGENEK